MNHITMNNTMIPYEFGFCGCMNSNNSTSLLNANGAIMDGYSTITKNITCNLYSLSTENNESVVDSKIHSKNLLLNLNQNFCICPWNILNHQVSPITQFQEDSYTKNLESYLINNFCGCDIGSLIPIRRYQFSSSCCENSSSHQIKFEDEFKAKDKSDNLNEHSNIYDEDKQLDIDKELKFLTNDDSNPLLSKSVEEVLQSSALNDALKSSTNYGVSRRRLYHLRQDVIIKIIFRQMKKYYLRDFKAFFDFSKCSNKNNSDTKGVLITQINRYLNMKFGSLNPREMDIFFASIIDMKEKYIAFSEKKNRDLKDNISGFLHSFNKPRLQSLLKDQRFKLLLLKFLSKSDILRLVIKSKNNAEVIQAYSEQIQMLKCQCNP